MKSNIFFISIFTILLLHSCDKKDDPAPVTPKTTTPVTPTKTYYFLATINGKAELVEFANGQSSSDHIVGPNTTVQRTGLFYSAYPSTNRSAYLSFYKYFPNQITIGGADIYPLMSVGSHSFSFDNGSSTVPGVSISWIDASGVEWSTENGSQAGSTFTIISRSAYVADYVPVNIEATFNCTLYKVGGQSIILKDGKYKGQGAPFY